ncbi:MAG: hypothetical protein HRT35_05580 [Algicola sp.]|nr:hypothetical protein [Algicola sp.]
MLSKLLRFELNYHRKQWVFWIGAVLLSWMAGLLTSQMGSPLDFANSAYSIHRTLSLLSMYIIFVVCVLTAATALRDSQFNMEPLVYATPIDKFHYLTSRFCGIFIATAMVFLVVLITMMVTPMFIEAERVGDFHLSHYLYGYFVFILPNILVCTGVAFAAAMLTKNTLSVYIAAIVLFVIHGIGSALGNSPLIANSTAMFHEGASIATLIDPYGGIAFFEQTAYWTGTDRNTRLPSLEGNLLFNRILWITIGLSLFAMTYNLFSFRAAKQKSSAESQSEPVSTVQAAYQVVKDKLDFDRFNFQVFWSKVRIEYRCVVKGKPFIILMIATVVSIGVEVIGNIMNGPLDNASPYYPITELILELIQDPIYNLGRLIAIFYAVELYWNERSHNIHPLTDATPTRNATFYLAKLTTVAAICMTIITLGILTAIAFQFSQGHFGIKPQLYLTLYYYAGMPLVLVAVFALFMQRFANNRATGLVMGALIFLLTQLVRVAGLAHPLTLFGFNPDFVFSDMADTLYHATAFNWFSLYWASFCAILAVYTVKKWRRGYDKQNQPLTPMGQKLLAAFAFSFIASGSYVYYQVNIFNNFVTRDTRFDIMEEYERNYSQYKDMAQPTVIDVKLDVDIYPAQNRYQTKGHYIIENQTADAIDTLLVGVLKKRHMEHTVSVAGATLDKVDELHNMYFFKLKQPLLPGQQTTMDFELSTVHNSFAPLDPEHYVTKGGSYIEMEDVLPQFGLVYSYIMTNEEERKLRGLALSTLEKPTSKMQHSFDDWVQFETTVSTSLEQTAVTPGNLEKSWVDNGRRYFQYKTDQKIAWQFAYTSAEFEVAKYQHNGIEIQIYHSPDHNKDNELLVDALSRSMDYFQQNIGPYTFKQYKIVELPYFSSRQSFGTAYPGMFLGVENRFFNLNNEGATINPQLRGVSHEFGHQYFGNYIEPYYIGGARMLTETLSKYTEVVLAEKTYGQYAINEEIGISINRYLRMRAYVTQTEHPLYDVRQESHIFYSKGRHSMHALRALVGEEKVNQALRSLLKNFAYPKKPTSLDLLNEFYKVATPKQIPVINDLFKRVVFHELRIDSAQTKALENGQFETTLDVITLKSVLDQKTNKEFNETIDDTLEIGFYDGIPATDNANMTLLKPVKFNKDNSAVTIVTDTKPVYVVIDPNRYRMDRNFVDNRVKL